MKAITEEIKLMTMQETPNFDPIGAAKDEAWKALGDIMSKAHGESPRKGRTVTVTNGKHSGKVGVVVWHGRNRFDRTGKCGSDMSNALSDAMGIYGFRVCVLLPGGEKVFMSAESVKVATASAS